jgi:hypothetical protein
VILSNELSRHRLRLRGCAATLALALSASSAYAGLTADDWAFNAQTTYVYQSKDAFPARYSGPNSLRPEHERSYTFSATAYLGLRPWSGGELFVNPEVVQGVALSRVTGLGGFTNGEIQKAAGPNLTGYRARLFLRQTFDLGGDTEEIDASPNHFAVKTTSDRLVVTLGNVSTIDIFGTNTYAGDPRTQFLNWSFLTYGAYDYAADLRGYTWGAAAEYYHGDWTLRAGRFMQPRQSNGRRLNQHLLESYGDQVEIERRHELGERPGKLQLLAYRNVARMANFSEALALARATDTTPDIAAVRRSQAKVGVGLGAEQAITDDLGVFARASMHDGRTETFAFTEIDRSLSAGAVMKGSRWGRGDDTFGLALVQNGISKSHRDYLAAGGTTFFLGDGALTYRPERILETYYRVGLFKGIAFTLDYQHISNPGYNSDRGPVNVGSVRLHAEF